MPDLTVTFADLTSLDIKLTRPQTVRDLISQINNSAGNNGKITAALNAAGNGLVLTGMQAFSVQSLATSTASDLGLDGASTGKHLDRPEHRPGRAQRPGPQAAPAQARRPERRCGSRPDNSAGNLNAGQGVSFQQDTGNDLEIQARDSTKIDVALGGTTTVGNVIDTINAAGKGVVTAALSKGDVVLTDLTSNVTVTAQNGSMAPRPAGPPQQGRQFSGRSRGTTCCRR